MGSEVCFSFSPIFMVVGISLSLQPMNSCWRLRPSHGSGGLSHGGVLLLGPKPCVDGCSGSASVKFGVGIVSSVGCVMYEVFQLDLLRRRRSRKFLMFAVSMTSGLALLIFTPLLNASLIFETF